MPGKSGSRRRQYRTERADYMMRVVPPMPPEEADAAFADWIATRRLDRSRFGPKDIQVITTRIQGAEQREYRVYYYAVREAEED